MNENKCNYAGIWCKDMIGSEFCNRQYPEDCPARNALVNDDCSGVPKDEKHGIKIVSIPSKNRLKNAFDNLGVCEICGETKEIYLGRTDVDNRRMIISRMGICTDCFNNKEALEGYILRLYDEIFEAIR